MGYAHHEIADMFPMMSEEEYSGLLMDIGEFGLRHPVVLYEGKVLDGRNRQRACEDLGKRVRYKEYGGIDPLSYVLSENLHRRHLSESQRAMVAAMLVEEGVVQRLAAERLSISERLLSRAVRVNRSNREDLKTKVTAGDKSVSSAERELGFPVSPSEDRLSTDEPSGDGIVADVGKDEDISEEPPIITDVCKEFIITSKMLVRILSLWERLRVESGLGISREDMSESDLLGRLLMGYPPVDPKVYVIDNGNVGREYYPIQWKICGGTDHIRWAGKGELSAKTE